MFTTYTATTEGRTILTGSFYGEMVAAIRKMAPAGEVTIRADRDGRVVARMYDGQVIEG